MSRIAFNAGAIEATLTLNRNPFSAGLAAARSEARSFTSRPFVASARVRVNDTEFKALEKRLKFFSGRVYTATARAVTGSVKSITNAISGANATTTVKANTSQAQRAIAQVQGQASRSVWMPLNVDPSQAKNALEELRIRVQNLKKAAKVTPTFETRTFIDQYGNMRTRLVKVSRDHGKFAAEALSSTFVKTMTLMKFNSIIVPILAAFGALYTSAAIAGLPAFFAKIAFDIQSKFGVVKAAVDNMKVSINEALKVDTSPLQGSFVRLAQAITTSVNSVRSELQTAFLASIPAIERAGVSIERIAKIIMPAVARAAVTANLAVDGFFDGIEIAATGVQRFFDAIMVAAPQAGQVFRTLGTIAADIMEMFGHLGASITKLFGGQLWNEAEGFFKSLTNIISDLAANALPMFGNGLEVAMTILGAILNIIEPIASAMGSWIGTILGVAIAIRSVSTAAGILSAAMNLLKTTAITAAFTQLATQVGSAGLAFANYTTKVTGSEAAGNRVAGVTNKVVSGFVSVGKALPIIGVAIAAVAVGYDLLKDKSADAAAEVVNGSKSMSQAIADETQAIMTRNEIAIQASGAEDIYAQAVNDGAEAFDRQKLAADANAEATKKIRAETLALLQQMAPLAAKQAEVTIAREEYTAAFEKFKGVGPQVELAASNLAVAEGKLKDAQNAAKDAAQFHTDALIELRDTLAGAASSDIAYQQALLKVKDAQKAAADAARDHKAGSDELMAAQLTLKDSALQAANAAAKLAEDNAKAAGAADTAGIASQAFKEELLRQADAIGGPVGQSLRDLANGLDTTQAATKTAELQANFFRDALGNLATQANGPTRAALELAQRNFDTVANSTMNADQKTQAWIGILNDLIATSSGPLKNELIRMRDQLLGLPKEHKFTVTADGRLGVLNTVGPGGTPIRWLGGGYTGGIIGKSIMRGFDGGGVLPGYTPGKDVHQFYSPTAGRIGLSGGEAIMRPEWTQAVGSNFINQANRAARMGGVGRVAEFMQQGGFARKSPRIYDEHDFAHPRGFASGGIIGKRNFADGGYIQTGLHPLEVGGQLTHDRLLQDVADRLTETAKARIRELEANMLGGGSGQGWQWQMNVLRQAFPGLALISGFRPGAITATGNKSYHSMGRAVDVPPRVDVFEWIRSHYGANTKELIFSPMGMRQIWNGQPHMYTGVTRADHWDHVHWAMRNGGIIPANIADKGGILRSGEAALNLSGKNERVLSPSETARYGSGGDLTILLSRLTSLLSVLSRGERGGFRDLHVHTPAGASVQEVVGEAMFQVKHARRRSVHS